MTRDAFQREAEDVFRGVWFRNFESISKYVRRRIAASEAADDVVAEIFSVAWRRLEVLPTVPNELPWLYGVAHNVVLTHFRAQRRAFALVDRLEANSRPSHSSIPQISAKLLSALQGLSDIDRELFRLTIWEELSQHDAGVVVGLSTKAVERRLDRARQKIRELCIEDNRVALFTSSRMAFPYEAIPIERNH